MLLFFMLLTTTYEFVLAFPELLAKLLPVLLRRLSELASIVERPLLACKLAELLQAVLEWDQLKVRQRFASHVHRIGCRLACQRAGMQGPLLLYLPSS